MTRDNKTRRVAGPPHAGGFSLLETTIAVGILGIGLILVAAVFPVALTQHRNNVDQARAIELVSKAESLLRARLDATRLWVDPLVTNAPGTDSPWYVLPMVNLGVSATTWDAMVVIAGPPDDLSYADVIDGVTPANYGPNNPLNPLYLYGVDILSDRVAPNSGGPFSPFTDSEFMSAPNRMVWFGFYRQPAAGPKSYATAVCKQRRDQIFFEQDLSVALPFANPTANTGSARRLPVPWRVSVGYMGANILSNAVAAPLLGGTLGIAKLAPIGTKIMLSGGSYSDTASPASVPAGTILTISDIIDDFTVEFVGDANDLPLFGAAVPHYTFDVWVFPPSVESTSFGKESPLMDWKVFQ
jgi:type II secretory pathway pseudopilin PulG